MTRDDRTLFAPEQVLALRAATEDLSLLLGRGYAGKAALKLVGDRHDLDARQRKAVSRAACGDTALVQRRRRQLTVDDLQGRPVWVDGLNCLITLQTAVSGALVLRCRDRCYRDLASVHGAYRQEQTTVAAIRAVGDFLHEVDVTWYLDRPVSGSGQLRSTLLKTAKASGWSWGAELVQDPDRVLLGAGPDAVVASSDSAVLDGCGQWIELVGDVMAALAPEAWVVDLG